MKYFMAPPKNPPPPPTPTNLMYGPLLREEPNPFSSSAKYVTQIS